MNLERETKLAAPPGFRLPDLSGDGFHTAEREPERLVTVYVDTPDLRIVRWGASLRQRRGEGWTVKLPAEEQGVALVRQEHVFEGEDPRRLPMAAVDLLGAYIRGAELGPVARLQTRRTQMDVTDELGRPLAAVTDDEVSVMEGRRVASRFREVEVELAEAAPREALETIVERLRAVGVGPVDNVPKLVRALGPRAQEPPDVVVPDLGKDAAKDANVTDVVRHALTASVVRLLRHDAGVRVGDDPESVHQARVATRRLRSDLRTLRDVVEPAWASRLRDELRRLGGELGAVRDAEVLRDRLRDRVEALDLADRAAGARLSEGLVARREEARGRLLTTLREPAYTTLLEELVVAANEPRVLEEAASLSAAAGCGPMLDGPWKHAEAAAKQAKDDPTDASLHALRIRTKRIRYASEAVAPVFGKRAAGFAKAAAELQDVLGEHQDAVVAGAWLREAATGDGDAFVAGQLVAMEARASAESRERWPAAWKALSRKRLRFWT
ncbi:MAG: CYTH and CHAD domain-containing protein [Actinobacteria bacterium]|nr:CYTH and CHAD domain-containing protein [Actinomycetota bacterium]